MDRIPDSSKRFERIFTCSRSRRTSNISKIIYKYFEIRDIPARRTSLKSQTKRLRYCLDEIDEIGEGDSLEKKKKRKRNRERKERKISFQIRTAEMLRRVAVKRVDCRGNENEGERTNARASCHYFRHAGATCRLVRACVQRSHVPPSSTKVNKIIIVSTR